MITCPICGSKSPRASHRCGACGADFSDPDVKAMAAQALDDGVSSELELGEAGALAGDRFLWISHERLISGPALKKLAMLGGVFLLIGFLIPIASRPGEWNMAWKSFPKAPALALWYPLIAGLVGLALALAPAISNTIKAAILVAAGLGGLIASVPKLGFFAGTSQHVLPVLTGGVLLAAIGGALRVYKPRSMEARLILAAGAAVTVAAMFIPIAETKKAIPIEFSFYIHDDDRWRDLSLFASYNKGITHDVLVRFLSLYGFSAMVIFPLAALVAWPQPGGVWDKSSSALRPMVWFMAMYIPLGYMLLLFNVTGWAESEARHAAFSGYWLERFNEFTKSLMVARAKIAVCSLFYTFWVVFGAVVIFDRFRGTGAHPASAD